MNGSILTNVAIAILDLFGVENPTPEDLQRFINMVRLDKLPDLALWIMSVSMPFLKWAIFQYLLTDAKTNVEFRDFIMSAKEAQIG